MLKKYFLISLLFIPANSYADEPEDRLRINDYLQATIDARYSYEYNDAGNRANKGNASTIRTRLGLKFLPINNISGFIEFENTSLVGPANFAHADNRKSARYPTINNPSNNELNQFYVNYLAPYNNNIRVGRQFLGLDDKRYLGDSSSSQNGVTFDSLYLTNTTLPYLKAQYLYLTRQIRNIGIETSGGTYDLDGTHMLNLNFAAVKDDTTTINIIPYNYLVSIKETPTASSDTKGLRFEASHKLGSITTGLLIDSAIQNDHDNNPNDYEFGYIRIEPKLNWNGFGVRVGYESFEGNGTASFQIPLGSRHSFNGWSDVITNPPANGLSDKYIVVTYDIKDSGYSILDDTRLLVSFDSMASDNGAIDYGYEYDAGFVKKLSRHFATGVEFSNYQADSIGPDTQKLWWYVTMNY